MNPVDPAMNPLRALTPAALFLCSVANASAARVEPADTNLAFYEGRVDRTAAHTVRMGFPGVTLHLKVRGAQAALILQVTKVAAFDLSVDGMGPKEILLSEGEHRVVLFEGEPAGEHEVELTRRTEGWQGTCEFRSIELGEQGELLPVAVPDRKLLFIGDSITCGSGVDRVSEADLTDPMRSDARLSFGKRIARDLGAQCHLVSYGGRGVIRDWQGIRATNNAPQFYELTMPDEPGLKWDFSSYVPDAIGICLGQNDFTQGIPDENEFVNAYVEFVRKVERDAPRAVIFLIDSPMQVDAPNQPPKRTVTSAYIDEVVSKVSSPNVRRLRLRHFPGGPRDSHPTAEDHVGMTAIIEPYFREVLGGTAQSQGPAAH
jgi:lysophospholipase L1-like esterase